VRQLVLHDVSDALSRIGKRDGEAPAERDALKSCLLILADANASPARNTWSNRHLGLRLLFPSI
jgi:hypothetical protein